MSIPIFFSSNDNYVPYLSVAMQSVMENAKNGRKYEFYVLYKNIKAEMMETLQKQVNLFSDFSLNFVDVSPYIKNDNFFLSHHITAESYFRLFIPYIFPNMEKAIYLDCDTVCLTDISQLFDIIISDYFIAGVSDAGLCLHYAPKWAVNKKITKPFDVLLNMKHPENYINCGVLLINCAKFREKYTLQDVIDTTLSRKWFCHDQDIISVLAKDDVFFFF
jgi:lipopolysaccharide biosynthesis glycosyltransferase